MKKSKITLDIMDTMSKTYKDLPIDMIYDWYMPYVEDLSKAKSSTRKQKKTKNLSACEKISNALISNPDISKNENFNPESIFKEILKEYGEFPISNPKVMKGNKKNILTILSYSLVSKNHNFLELLKEPNKVNLMVKSASICLNGVWKPLKRFVPTINYQNFEVIEKLVSNHFLIKLEKDVLSDISIWGKKLNILKENDIINPSILNNIFKNEFESISKILNTLSNIKGYEGRSYLLKEIREIIDGIMTNKQYFSEDVKKMYIIVLFLILKNGGKLISTQLSNAYPEESEAFKVFKKL